MHEAARHAIHITEVLTVSVQTAETMLQNLARVSGYSRNTRGESQHHLTFQIQMLRNLLLRSQSNKERLQNEVAQVRAVSKQRIVVNSELSSTVNCRVSNSQH